MERDDTREGWEWEYEAAVRDYDAAGNDTGRDAALMMAHWALVNLTDWIDRRRAELTTEVAS